ncbi:2095_t:CDS:2, partial [Racocetra fulgida]
YARILVEMVDRISEMSDLTLSLDGWMDVSNNSIYAFLLHKFENINEIINIEEFSSIRHTASNLLVAIINSLQNVSIDFSKIIAIVTDNPSVMIWLQKDISEKYQYVIVLRYIVDAIAKLESNNTTLGDIFAELLFIYKKLKSSEFEDFDYGLIDHAKNI